MKKKYVNKAEDSINFSVILFEDDDDDSNEIESNFMSCEFHMKQHTCTKYCCHHFQMGLKPSMRNGENWWQMSSANVGWNAVKRWIALSFGNYDYVCSVLIAYKISHGPPISRREKMERKKCRLQLVTLMLLQFPFSLETVFVFFLTDKIFAYIWSRTRFLYSMKVKKLLRICSRHHILTEVDLVLCCAFT